MPVVLHKKRGQKIHKLQYEIFGMGHTFQRVLLLFTVNLSELLSALHKQSWEIITKCAAINCKIRWPYFNLKAESTHSILTYFCNQSTESAHQEEYWLRPREYSLLSLLQIIQAMRLYFCTSFLTAFVFGTVSLWRKTFFFLHQLVHCMPLSAQM